jgi:hypothetical protein
MAVEWSLVIRCKGPSLALVSLHGTQTELEPRAGIAIVWGDTVEYFGPKLGIEKEKKDSFASVADLKDNLKKLRRSSQEDLQ